MKLKKIETVKKIEYSGLVYDLHVDKDFSYNINKIAVHNSMCTTRLMTGCGVPNIKAIWSVNSARQFHQSKGIKIIADGGIKYPGDIVKALTVGADYVMIGTGFANCKDSAAKVVNGKKVQRGQASEEYQMEYLGKVRNGCAEGVTRHLEIDGKTISEKVEYYIGGLRSAISYLGLRNSEDIYIDRVKILKCESTIMLENRPMD